MSLKLRSSTIINQVHALDERSGFAIKCAARLDAGQQSRLTMRAKRARSIRESKNHHLCCFESIFCVFLFCGLMFFSDSRSNNFQFNSRLISLTEDYRSVHSLTFLCRRRQDMTGVMLENWLHRRRCRATISTPFAQIFDVIVAEGFFLIDTLHHWRACHAENALSVDFWRGPSLGMHNSTRQFMKIGRVNDLLERQSFSLHYMHYVFHTQCNLSRYRCYLMSPHAHLIS